MSDNNATELKPCPICGMRATIHSWWSDDEECGKASVGCSRESYTNGYECARIFIMRVNEKTAREDAIRIWNTRTPEQAVAATLGHELNPDGLPVGLTISDDENLLNWRGENYVKQAVAATLGADDGSRWFELFGTPERAARFMADYTNCVNRGCSDCACDDYCSPDFELGDYDVLLAWLRGKAVK